jgi:hypothetical protein
MTVPVRHEDRWFRAYETAQKIPKQRKTYLGFRYLLDESETGFIKGSW